MNVALKEQITEKLNQVPEANLSQVMDFLEFLAWKAQQMPSTGEESRSTSEYLQILRGRGRGERLVERLLQARQADRTLDKAHREF